MNFPFSASAIKVSRARHHIEELEKEFSSFLNTNPVRFTSSIADIDSNGLRQRTISFNLNYKTIPEWSGAIIGDAVHNLRTALDLAACEMVRAAGQTDDGVYFPFCESVDELQRMIARRHFDRAGPDAVALVSRLKPYRNGNTALRALHDLDIQDKHRMLIPSSVAIGSPVIQIRDDDGTVNPKIIGDSTVASEIKFVFPNGSVLAGNEIVSTLRELAELVDGIVGAFRDLANRNDGRASHSAPACPTEALPL